MTWFDKLMLSGVILGVVFLYLSIVSEEERDEKAATFWSYVVAICGIVFLVRLPFILF